MKINEIFYSIQGEGIYIGLPMIFIRTTGCNLRCRWCDTTYAYEAGEELAITEIMERLKAYKSRELCLTGGEPLTQEDTPSLIEELIKNGYSIYLETNGSIFLGNLPGLDAIKLSMDIKCPSSGEEQKMNLSNLDLLGAGDQIKFIIVDDNDYDYAKDFLEKHKISSKCAIIFTPCWLAPDKLTDNALTLRKLAERVLSDRLSVRVLPQLHKLVWPERSRGV